MNRLFKCIFCMLLFCFFVSGVFAAPVKEIDLVGNGNEDLLICSYKSEDSSDEEKIELHLKYNPSNGYHVSIYRASWGTEKTDYFMDSNDDDFPSGGAIVDIKNYLLSNLKCPTYAAMYGSVSKKFVFSGSSENLNGSKMIFKNTRVSLDDSHFCFYKYSNGWEAFIIKKDLLGNLLNSEVVVDGSCPSSIVTSSKEREFLTGLDDVNDLYYIYGANSSEDEDKLKNQCRADINNDYGEKKHFSEKYLNCSVASNYIISNGDNPSGDEPSKPIDCSALFDDEMVKFIGDAYFVIEIIGIVLVIVLTAKDYAVIILQSNQDEMKKANARLLKRLIVLIVIFILPSLIKLIINVFDIQGLYNNDPLCGYTVKK